MTTHISTSNEDVPDTVRTDLFSLQPIDGKGKGLIATQTIEPGTCLISEAPLFTTADIKSADVERELVRIVKGLPKDSQRAFLSLHNNNPGREPFSNIIRSNGYPLGASSDIGGIFLNIARINHSCLANTQQAWNVKRNQETAYVVRRIKEGDEITISYTIGGPSRERRSQLKRFFSFDCNCEICSLPSERLEESDANYSKIAALDSQIGDPKRVKRAPEKALADCFELLQLYKKEDINDSRLPRLYYDAFQICAMHSDEARASEFAKMCAQARTICEGDDSADAQEMMGFAEHPGTHEAFGGSKKWQQNINQVPSGLDQEDFQNWLWKKT